jgi:hypothetical protein
MSHPVPPYSGRTLVVSLPDELWSKIDLEMVRHQLPPEVIVSVYLRLYMSGAQYSGPDFDDPS